MKLLLLPGALIQFCDEWQKSNTYTNVFFQSLFFNTLLFSILYMMSNLTDYTEFQLPPFDSVHSSLLPQQVQSQSIFVIQIFG